MKKPKDKKALDLLARARLTIERDRLADTIVDKSVNDSPGPMLPAQERACVILETGLISEA